MKIYADRLHSHALAPHLCYVLSGDEPLLQKEASDWLRGQLHTLGLVEERHRFVVDSDLQWSRVFDAASALSLFAQSQLIELHFDKLPDKAQQQALNHLVGVLHEQCRLLIVLPKIGKPQEKQAWCKYAIEQGILAQSFALEGRQLQQWLAQRLKNYGFVPSQALCALLLHYFEGNLLALDQAIQTLALQNLGTQPDLAHVEQCLSHANRFTAYQFSEALIQGDIKRAALILAQLQQEGDEPTLVNWSLERDIKLLMALQRGENSSEVFRRYGVWAKRQSLYQNAQQLHHSQQLHQARLILAKIDHAIKQFDGQSAWRELNQLLLIFSRACHG